MSLQKRIQKKIKRKRQHKDWKKRKNIILHEIKEIEHRKRRGFSIRFPKSRKFQKPVSIPVRVVKVGWFRMLIQKIKNIL